MDLEKRISAIAIGVTMLAGASGAAYAGLLQPDFVGVSSPSYVEIQAYGQDTDGDGIATSEEGAIDLDGDGRFGAAEQEHFGLKHYINWAYPEDLENLSLATAGRVCAAACIISQGEMGCRANTDTVNCISIGSFCYTVACSFPCSCPIP